ncbi:MAG: dienelactone hydrolase family protein [Planctomycetota bacterium]|jgi:putative phosphoribosyl transferase
MTTPPIEQEIALVADGQRLPGLLTVPDEACGLVLFVHGSGSSRLSPRNRAVAATLVARGCATLLFDLLTDEEATDRRNVFDIPLLARRVAAAAADVRRRPELASLPIGYFGASTGGGAALVAAAAHPGDVVAVVSRGGRPDLAGEALPRVQAPALLLVGSADPLVLDLNRQAQAQMTGECRLVVVEGATHLFEEPGTLEQVADEAGRWFVEKFAATVTA